MEWRSDEREKTYNSTNMTRTTSRLAEFVVVAGAGGYDVRSDEHCNQREEGGEKDLQLHIGGLMRVWLVGWLVVGGWKSWCRQDDEMVCL